MTKPPRSGQASYETTSADDIGVLLVGHGTRDRQGQEQFLELFRHFARFVSPLTSQPAFLELAEPTISQAVERLTESSLIRRLIVVPALLFTAGHAEEDIPRAVQSAVDSLEHKCNLHIIGQTPTLECSTEVLELSATRFRQAMSCGQQCAVHCAGSACARTRWLLVGRGSSSQSAALKLQQFMQLRQQWTPVEQASVAYIFGQTPTVEQELDRLLSSDASRIVVQPHLLFSGRLLDELRHQVQECGSRNPRQAWVITDTLGGDWRLAELLGSLALAQLTGPNVGMR
ncbi:MAG: sirohydrochlorin chelatase [Pirellulaceae bacterium]|nr:sirohydrochlorin chelatase [Pirellulaceae bacterium]